MSTEHQDGKPQLPRVIEQKPIVYDDIDLMKNRNLQTGCSGTSSVHDRVSF